MKLLIKLPRLYNLCQLFKYLVTVLTVAQFSSKTLPLNMVKKISTLLSILFLVEVLSIHKGPSGVGRRMEMEKKQWGQRRFEFGFFMEVGRQRRWRHKMTLEKLMKKENQIVVQCTMGGVHFLLN